MMVLGAHTYKIVHTNPTNRFHTTANTSEIANDVLGGPNANAFYVADIRSNPVHRLSHVSSRAQIASSHTGVRRT